ncbi:hypothetical protein SDC9_181642 [bioreactor metagenome]|uniref:Uncharacterized protein n=1 Tax=bioreactor metagenome TaxID=1076179 RepID=A0A645H7T1_9ZZZZ
MTADIRRAWHDASPAQRAEVQELATQLHAELGMSVILGRLDDYRGEPEYALWRSLSRGGTRLEEWWGRIRAARTWRERVVLIARLPLVNQQHLAAILGHKPSVRELIGEFFARPMRAIRSELGKRRGAAR